MEFILGILLGLSTLLFVGPVFFYLLKSTLEHSVKAGLAVAIGIIIGDIIYVFLVIKGMSGVFENEENSKWLALIGGIMLIGIGIKYLLNPSTKTEISANTKGNSLLIYGINGFLINFVNPFVVGVWVLFLGINRSKLVDESSVITSLVFTLLIIFLTDCLKVVFANKLKEFIKPGRLKKLLKAFGFIMILFGLRLLWVMF